MQLFNVLKKVSILLFLFGTATAALGVETVTEEKAVKERILFYDGTYSVRYAGDIEPAINYFTAYGFKLMNTPQLLKWIEEKIKGRACYNTVVLQLSDITPNGLAEPWDKTSPLYRYCENGGRWVAPAGNTLYAFEGANDFNIFEHDAYVKDTDKYITRCFGIHPVYGLKGKGRVLTPEGKTWGLSEDSDKWMKYLQIGVPCNDVTPLVISEEGNAALAWYKNVNSNYPYSGLVGTCINLSNYEPVLRLIHRLCIFDGKDVNIQAKDWKAKDKIQDFAVKFNPAQGGIPRKAFQRGEIIPLSIDVYGNKYAGQEIKVQLRLNENVVWGKNYPTNKLKTFSTQEPIDTTLFRCGEYLLEGFIDGQKINQENIWICPERRNNSFPFLVGKGHRRNSSREDLALKYIRDNNVNAMIYDLYQFEGAWTNSKTMAILGNYLDLLLRNNLMVSARPTAMNLYTDKPDEKLILYDGTTHKHGVNHEALSWRGFVANYLDEYREGLRRQVSLLRNSKSPAIIPYFFTNDDGSMGGNYDFNPITMTELQKKTRLTKNDLPPMNKMKEGNNVFMPVVSPGIIDDNNPWLQYFRYHCGNYNRICQAAMEGIESGWPGSLVADAGCMSGPLYIPRGFYPPLSAKAYNTASFYQYLFWLHQYPFAIETALMNNRNKPVGIFISASLIAWGPEFQRGVLYRILAESPKFIGLYHLDDRKKVYFEQEEATWQGTNAVAGKIAKISEFLKLQETTHEKGALFFGLAQNCFRSKDPHTRPFYMSTALENFQRAGTKLDLISTEEIMQGILSQYKIVFINDHQWMTKGEKKAFEDYVARGGVVVTDSNTTINIKGAIKADGPFGEGLNDLGKPERIERCRKYVDTYLNPSLVKPISENTIVRVNQINRVPIAWVFDVESDEELRGLQKAQSDDWNTGVYKYLKARVAISPDSNKKILIKAGYFAYDLWNNKELFLEKSKKDGWNIGELTIERLSANPIVLYQDKIHKIISSNSPGSLACGDTLIAGFELLSDKNTPVRGLVPAEVAVYAPDGKEVWEYGGNTVIDNGVLTVRFSMAVNDAPGKWKIIAKELCSGKSAEVIFDLKK